MVVVSSVYLSLLCGASQATLAADSSYLFPVQANYDDQAWTEITPSEAVRLVDDAIAKQPKYGSARAEFWVYLANEFESDRDAMVQLFGELRTTDTAAKLREMTATLLRHQEDSTQKLNWSEVTITEDGDNVLEKCEKWSNVTQSSAYLTTDEIKIVYEGMIHQADVALPGLQNRMLVNRLAYFDIALKPAKEQYVVSAARSSDLVKLVRGSRGIPGRTTIFSLRDGNVVHDYNTSPEGTLVDETWQGPLKEWAGGVQYPTSLLHFRYTDGAVTYVKAVAVKHAEFNVRVEPSEFVVAVPAGTTVVDVREGEPAVVQVEEPIDDLVSALDDGLPTKVRSAKQ